MKKHFTAFLSGVLITALLFTLGLSALAVSGKLTLEVDPVNIQVDGTLFVPKDEKGNEVPVFAYNGTSYAPVRALAEAYGLFVGYDKETNMVSVSDVAEAPTRFVTRRNNVTVRTAEELVAAIAPDTEIILEPGEYNLTELAGKTNNPYVVWTDEFDGPQLNVIGVDALTLRGQNETTTNILVTPRYADVFHFQDCSGIVIDRLTMGHTPTGSCFGSVLEFYESSGILVTTCNLYGCGAYGLELNTVTNLDVQASSIYHCSYGAVIASDLQNMVINNCNIFDNTCYTPFDFYNSHDVAITNTAIHDNVATSEYFPELLSLKESHNISFTKCKFDNNRFPTFSNIAPGGGELTLGDCTFENNDFMAP